MVATSPEPDLAIEQAWLSQAEIGSLTRALEAARAEVERSRTVNRDLHRRAQKAEGHMARGGRQHLLRALARYIHKHRVEFDRATASDAQNQRLLAQVATLTTALDATADALAATEVALAEARAVIWQVEWVGTSFQGACCPICKGHKPEQDFDPPPHPTNIGHTSYFAIASVLKHQGSEP